MKTVRIDGYLVQAKLEAALKEIVRDAVWHGSEVPVGARRQRWDMVFECEERLVAVEFDGAEHYRHTLKIKADREKDEATRLAGHRVVRFPYWIQLTTETLRHYFGLEAEVVQDFPHGFITTKVFPASFCALGIARFERELEALPVGVRSAVVLSLRERAREHGIEYVVPPSLRRLLDDVAR